MLAGVGLAPPEAGPGAVCVATPWYPLGMPMKAVKAAPMAAITAPMTKAYPAVVSQNLRKSNIVVLPGSPGKAVFETKPP